MLNQSQQTRMKPFVSAFLLAAACFAAYFPAFDAGYIWDDDNYVTENYTLRTLDGLRDIWLKPAATPQYYPLVHMTFWLEYQVWELNPTGYHATNVCLHLLNALLLLHILRLLGVPWAFACALLFAIHPVHTESVVWITERKNVLSGFFYLASLAALLKSADDTESAHSSHRRKFLLYGFGFVLYLMALLSKTVVVTLPVALLICLYWRNGVVRRKDLMSVLPMLVIGLPFGLMTVHLERTHVGALGPWWDYSLLERVLIAGQAFWFYLMKIVYPHPLVFIYPQWAVQTSNIASYVFSATAVAAVITAACYRRGIAMAILYFSVTISPALGFVNIYPMRYTFAADHYQYLASIGPILIIVSSIWWLFGFSHRQSSNRMQSAFLRRARWMATVLILTVCSALIWRTRVEIKKYENSETLWRDTLAKDPESEIAWVNLGNVLRDRGQFERAFYCYHQAMMFDAQDAVAGVNAALILHVTGRTETAISELRQIIQIGLPETWMAHYNLGVILLNRHALDEAKWQLEQALKLRSDHGHIQNALGLVAWKQRNTELAEEFFRAAASVSPEFIDSSVNLGALLNSQLRHSEAAEILAEVLDTHPNHVKARLHFDAAILRQ